MGRQGKMHSSPFHVESSTYKYAIEHENDGYMPSNNLENCDYRKIDQLCRLWNSGFVQCASFKCRYYQTSRRRAGATCPACAYYFNSKCSHPQKPNLTELEISTAEFCHFFVCEQENVNKFKEIRWYKIREYLTAQLKRKKHLVKSWNKYVRDAEQEMVRIGPEHEDYSYLADKISARKKAIPNAEKEIVQIQSDLARIGGELREKSSKKKK